jgi:hypothetical protein
MEIGPDKKRARIYRSTKLRSKLVGSEGKDLLDELKALKQSRLRAWNALQRLRLVLSEAGNVVIPHRPKRPSMRAFGGVREFLSLNKQSGSKARDASAE